VTLSLGVRPRSEADRLALCQAVLSAPGSVGIGWADDGWAAAHLAIAGREVCWGHPSDSGPVERLLARLGLPPLSSVEPEGWLPEDLVPEWNAAPRSRPLPPVDGPITSILICTYNRAHLLPESIDSARAQTRPREIIVVDDGSDDGTAELLAPLDGLDGIRVVRQENTGKPGALARALAEARGEYVLVLDDDDLLLPGALHALARPMDADPALAAVFGDTAIVHDTADNVQGHRPAIRLPPAMLPASTLIQVPCMPGACLIRRSAHDTAGEYDAGLVRGQDMDLFLRLCRVGAMECLPLTTFLWREHGGLRGKAGDRWSRTDRAGHDRRFRAQVAPVFRRRWAALRNGDRLQGHAWAVGLALRGMRGDSKRELARHKPPYSPVEAALRVQAGRPGKSREPSETLLVIDDGDAGALELTLAEHAAGRAVRVCLEVHREPLNQVETWWPGQYRAQQIDPSWLTGTVHLRLSSAPSWSPPPITAPRDLAPIPAPSAVLALAAVRDWALPQRTRPGLRWTPHPVAAAAVETRRHLRAGDARAAMTAIVPVCEALPFWTGAWSLASEAFAALGLVAEAEACRQRAA